MNKEFTDISLMASFKSICYINYKWKFLHCGKHIKLLIFHVSYYFVEKMLCFFVIKIVLSSFETWGYIMH